MLPRFHAVAVWFRRCPARRRCGVALGYGFRAHQRVTRFPISFLPFDFSLPLLRGHVVLPLLLLLLRFVPGDFGAYAPVAVDSSHKVFFSRFL
jgi:hypothetical protein